MRTTERELISPAMVNLDFPNRAPWRSPAVGAQSYTAETHRDHAGAYNGPDISLLRPGQTVGAFFAARQREGVIGRRRRV